MSKLQWLHIRTQGISAVDKCAGGVAHAERSRTQAHAQAAPSARASTSKAHSGRSNSCSSSSEESINTHARCTRTTDARIYTHKCTHTGWAKCPPGLVREWLK